MRDILGFLVGTGTIVLMMVTLRKINNDVVGVAKAVGRGAVALSDRQKQAQIMNGVSFGTSLWKTLFRS